MSPPPVQWIVARIDKNKTAIALHFLELAGFAYYCPRAVAIKRGRPCHTVGNPLFAPYFFVSLSQGQNWGDVRRSPAIASIVLRSGVPAIVPPQIIDALKSRENRHGLIDLAPRLRRGMKVQITSGPLALMEGVLAADPRDRVRVLFDCILGASREVSFPRRAVTAI